MRKVFLTLTEYENLYLEKEFRIGPFSSNNLKDMMTMDGYYFCRQNNDFKLVASMFQNKNLNAICDKGL